MAISDHPYPELIEYVQQLGHELPMSRFVWMKMSENPWGITWGISAHDIFEKTDHFKIKFILENKFESYDNILKNALRENINSIVRHVMKKKKNFFFKIVPYLLQMRTI
jgi:hypothetical protein